VPGGAVPPAMKRLALCLALGLAACSPAADDETDAQAAPEATPAKSPPPRTALTAEDIEAAQLSGELSCSFAERGVRAPLLVASADVDDAARPVGVLKLGSSALRLQSSAAGGFNAMVEGARFTSGDLTAQVAVTSREPLDDSEAPPLAAVLEVGSAATGMQRIVGEWACGP
jgi:hypothetical protein